MPDWEDKKEWFGKIAEWFFGLAFLTYIGFQVYFIWFEHAEYTHDKLWGPALLFGGIALGLTILFWVVATLFSSKIFWKITGVLAVIVIIGVVIFGIYKVAAIKKQEKNKVAAIKKQEKNYTYWDLKRWTSFDKTVSKRTKYIEKDDYYETTYEYGKQITRKRNDSYNKKIGYDMIVKVQNKMSYRRLRSTVKVWYAVSVTKALYYYDCGRIYIGNCESYRYNDDFLIKYICIRCTNIHNDVSNLLKNKKVNIPSKKYSDEIEFYKEFTISIPAGQSRNLKSFLPNKLKFGKDNEYTSQLDNPKIKRVSLIQK